MVRSMLRRIQGCASSYVKSLDGKHRLLCQLSEIGDQLGQYRAGSVDLEKDADTGIAVLTLNNPEKKNAMSGSMMVELADCVTELSEWKEGKGLVLQGAGHTFCSGGDLASVAAILNSRDGDRMAQFMHDTTTRLHNLPLVSLALVQGLALGGGAELSTACDVRVMTESARVGFVQIKMGVTTGWGGATRLVSLLGRPRSLRLLGSGKVFTADQALELGLCDHVIPDAPDPLAAARLLLQKQYCSGEIQLVRSVKEDVVDIETSASVEEALTAERRIFASVWGGGLQKAALAKNIKHS